MNFTDKIQFKIQCKIRILNRLNDFAKLCRLDLIRVKVQEMIPLVCSVTLVQSE